MLNSFPLIWLMESLSLRLNNISVLSVKILTESGSDLHKTSISIQWRNDRVGKVWTDDFLNKNDVGPFKTKLSLIRNLQWCDSVKILYVIPLRCKVLIVIADVGQLERNVSNSDLFINLQYVRLDNLLSKNVYNKLTENYYIYKDNLHTVSVLCHIYKGHCYDQIWTFCYLAPGGRQMTKKDTIGNRLVKLVDILGMMTNAGSIIHIIDWI